MKWEISPTFAKASADKKEVGNLLFGLDVHDITVSKFFEGIQ